MLSHGHVGHPPSLMGCGVQGISDTLLHEQRSAAAKAIRPDGAGQNVDGTLLVGDGRRGAADPVFAACDPILL